MLKYFSEIKSRLLLLLLTWISTIVVGYLYKEVLLFSIVQPNIFAYYSDKPSFFYFIFTSVTEIFSVYVKLVLFISFQILLLYLIYHFWGFLSPALFYSEYFYLSSVTKVILIIWFFSQILLNYLLVPLTWNFFLSFQHFIKTYSFNLHFEAKLSEYLDFYIELYYICVLYCQIFTVLFLFLINTNTTIKVAKKFRKLYYYFFIIFSTLISPPDVFSQILISLSTVILYEGLFFTFIFRYSIILLIRQPIKTDKNAYSKKKVSNC